MSFISYCKWYNMIVFSQWVKNRCYYCSLCLSSTAYPSLLHLVMLLTFTIVALNLTLSLSLSYQADVSATFKDELLPQHEAVVDQTTLWARNLQCWWSCYSEVQSPSSILNYSNDPSSSQQIPKVEMGSWNHVEDFSMVIANIILKY